MDSAVILTGATTCVFCEGPLPDGVRTGKIPHTDAPDYPDLWILFGNSGCTVTPKNDGAAMTVRDRNGEIIHDCP